MSFPFQSYTYQSDTGFNYEILMVFATHSSSEFHYEILVGVDHYEIWVDADMKIDWVPQNDSILMVSRE